MKSFQEGTRLTLTGLTSPPRMRRSDASPDADTMSYCEPPPWRIRVTISSQGPSNLLLTLQPVCVSNGFTRSGGVMPSQETRFSLPMHVPIFVGSLELLPAPFLPQKSGAA